MKSRFTYPPISISHGRLTVGMLPPPVKQLPREADWSRFRVMSADGQRRVHPVEAGICAIVHRTANGIFKFVGTGFFIGVNGLLATARHNIDGDDFRLNDGDIWCRALYFGDARTRILHRDIIAAALHAESDLALAATVPINFDSRQPLTRTPIHVMTSTIPATGSHIHTCGFPKTAVENRDDGAFGVSFMPAYYEGRISEFLPTGRPKLRGPCFQTSMTAHQGSSGGPVFDERGRVIGVVSRGWDLPDEEESLSYVTSIRPLLDMVLPLPLKDGRRITVRELAALDNAAIMDDQ